MPAVEFTDKLKDVKAVETEDAVFQCVLSTPLNSITWSKDDSSLESGDKYEISVSEDRLTHTLRVKDCEVADAGRYYAIAGLTSNSASLAVKGKSTALHGMNPMNDLYGFTFFLVERKNEKPFLSADPERRKARMEAQRDSEVNQAKQQDEKDGWAALEEEEDEDDSDLGKSDGAADRSADGSGDGTDGKSGNGSGIGEADGTAGRTDKGEDGKDGKKRDNSGENQGDDADDKKKRRLHAGPLVPESVRGKIPAHCKYLSQSHSAKYKKYRGLKSYTFSSLNMGMVCLICLLQLQNLLPVIVNWKCKYLCDL